MADKVQTLVSELNLDFSKFNSGLRNSENIARNSGERISRAFSSIKFPNFKAVGAGIATGMGTLFAGVSHGFHGMIQQFDDAATAADRYKISASEAFKMQQAVKILDTTPEELGGMIKKQQTTTNDQKTLTKLSSLGVNTKAPAFVSRNQLGIMLEVLKTMNGMSKEQDRITLSNMVWGAKLGSVSGSIGGMDRQLKSINAIMSNVNLTNKDIARGADLAQQMDELSVKWITIKNKVMTALIPILESILTKVDNVLNKLVSWVGKGSVFSIIVGTIVVGLAGIPSILGSVGSTLVTIIGLMTTWYFLSKKIAGTPYQTVNQAISALNLRRRRGEGLSPVTLPTIGGKVPDIPIPSKGVLASIARAFQPMIFNAKWFMTIMKSDVSWNSFRAIGNATLGIITGGFAGLIKTVGILASSIWSMATATYAALAPWLAIPLAIAGVSAAFQMAWNLISSGFTDAHNWMSDMIDSWVPSLGDFIDKFFDIIIIPINKWLDDLKSALNWITGKKEEKAPELGVRSEAALKSGKIKIAPDVPDQYANVNKRREANKAKAAEDAQNARYAAENANPGISSVTDGLMVEEQRKTNQLLQKIYAARNNTASERALSY